MANKLAIIIPAYKDAFFNKTLESLAQQTNKNFTVYIGDDNSPYNLEKIVSEYSNQLNIIYKRFPTNLGSTDLVLQWNRCLSMIQDEDFFCLFSDDDIMEPTCVENFYKSLQTNGDFDVFHFDINLINAKGEVTSECPHILLSCPQTTFYICCTQIELMPECLNSYSRLNTFMPQADSLTLI